MKEKKYALYVYRYIISFAKFWECETALDAFAKTVMATNPKLWDASLTFSKWYSQDLLLWLGGQPWKLTLPNFEVLAAWVKFLELSGYGTVISFTFTTTNVFSCFHSSIMAQFKLINHKFPNQTMLHVHVQLSNHM